MIIIKKQDIVHLIFVFFSSLIFMSYSLKILPLMSKTFDDIFMSQIILKYSYYPNRTCRNIPKNQFIKLIGTNKVSISSINNLDYMMLNFRITNPKVKFQTKQCINN